MRTSNQICLNCHGKGYLSGSWGECHCPDCYGTGFMPAKKMKCLACDGRGYHYKVDKDGKKLFDDKGYHVMYTCQSCNGEGYIY